MISFEQALSELLSLAKQLESEMASIEDASGRILASDAIATHNQPPFDASAMDGYALQKSDKLPNKKLSVIGRVAAGGLFDGSINKNQAVRIFTGAPLPAGADSVLIQEDAEVNEDNIVINDNIDANDYIRKKGDDYKKGEVLLQRGKTLKSFDIALLASMNFPLVNVIRRPLVSIISTGDELVYPGNLPTNNQIVASNTFGLNSLVNKWGATGHILPISRDNKSSINKALDLAVPADLVITIGGASVGDHDYIKDVFRDKNITTSFYKVAMKPGKPILAGKNKDTIFIGLPGNPVSALVCAHLFIKPLIGKMLGTNELANIEKQAILLNDLPANGERKHFMRGFKKDGFIEIFSKQDSSLLSILQKANSLVIRAPNEPALKKGNQIGYFELD